LARLENRPKALAVARRMVAFANALIRDAAALESAASA
jgi:hypothetical protein